MVNIGRYKPVPQFHFTWETDRYPAYKGGKVMEVVVYANYIGLHRFY